MAHLPSSLLDDMERGISTPRIVRIEHASQQSMIGQVRTHMGHHIATIGNRSRIYFSNEHVITCQIDTETNRLILDRDVTEQEIAQRHLEEYTAAHQKADGLRKKYADFSDRLKVLEEKFVEKCKDGVPRAEPLGIRVYREHCMSISQEIDDCFTGVVKIRVENKACIVSPGVATTTPFFPTPVVWMLSGVVDAVPCKGMSDEYVNVEICSNN